MRPAKIALVAKRKDPHAVALGRRGGKAAAGAGLRTWYDDMTKAERSALAKKAAAARWSKKPKKAT